jgi:5,10-methylenetetrahydromethanopterin reductase
MRSQSLSIAFQTDKPLAAYGDLARAAEAWGFDAITVYNDMLYQPAWLPLLEIARQTSRAQIGVAAVNPFTCHPLNIAGNIALIDEASAGRAYLGLARGGWLDFVGLYPGQPVSALREALLCIRHLLSGSREPLEQELYPLAGGDSLRWNISRPDLPFLLGSWGHKTLAACHHLVEEIKLGGSANPLVIPHYRELLAAMGADPDTGIVVGAVTVVDEDGAAARALAKREVALYLPVVAELDKTLTIEPEVLAAIKSAAAEYNFDAAVEYISDELLAAFALAGTPADIIRQTEALFDAGASRVEYGTPHGLQAETGLRLLGEQVLPAFRTE